MKRMSTIKFPNQTEAYEIVDAAARVSLDSKSDIDHTHVRSEISDFAHEHDERYYTESEIDSKISDLQTSVSGKVNTSDIADNLTTDDATKVLSASQGTVIKTLIDSLQDDINGSVADWNENDETALSYVKNRTHWIKHAETLLSAETFTCTTQTSDGDSYYCAKNGNIGLVSGNKYNVTVNGTTYTASALNAFGSDDVSLIAHIDTCRIYDRSNGTVEVFSNNSSTLTITIVDAEDVYVKLDEKFIPDIFARKTDVEDKMNTENPTGSGSLSINRKQGSTVGENSIAIGTDCIASGASSVALGSSTTASGFGSYAIGSGTVASGDISHASGQDSKATGFAAYATGSGEANGDYAFASGYSIADGNYSYAAGNGTWAVGRSQTVIGEANLEDSATDAATRGTYAFIIGNGDMDAGEYSNAATVDWSGNAWVAGNVYVGGTSKDEGVKLATEDYVSSNSDIKTTELLDVVEGDEPTMPAIVDERFIALENRVTALEGQLATAIARLSLI